MAFKIYEILQKEPFKSLEQAKKDEIKKVLENIEGKTVVEAMPIVMKFVNENKKTQKFSEQDKALMISVMMETLNPEDRKKFKAMNFPNFMV